MFILLSNQKKIMQTMVLGLVLINNPDLQRFFSSLNGHCCYFMSYF